MMQFLLSTSFETVYVRDLSKSSETSRCERLVSRVTNIRYVKQNCKVAKSILSNSRRNYCTVCDAFTIKATSPLIETEQTIFGRSV